MSTAKLTPASPPAPICQWCGQPVQGTATWWDEKPQCANPFACNKRILRSTSTT